MDFENYKNEVLKICREIYDNASAPEGQKELYEKYPHLFVFCCVMDSQLDADKVWRIPLIIAEELGGKEFYRFLEKDEELLKESYKIFLSLYPYLKTKEYITTLFGTYDN